MEIGAREISAKQARAASEEAAWQRIFATIADFAARGDTEVCIVLHDDSRVANLRRLGYTVEQFEDRRYSVRW